MALEPRIPPLLGTNIDIRYNGLQIGMSKVAE